MDNDVVYWIDPRPWKDNGTIHPIGSAMSTQAWLNTLDNTCVIIDRTIPDEALVIEGYPGFVVRGQHEARGTYFFLVPDQAYYWLSGRVNHETYERLRHVVRVRNLDSGAL